MKIKYIQLKNGIELLCRINPDDVWTQLSLELYDPLQMLIPPSSFTSTEHSVLLNEWVPFIDKDYVTIPMSEILLCEDVNKDMTDFYIDVAKKFAEFNKMKKEGTLKKILHDDIAMDPVAALTALEQLADNPVVQDMIKMAEDLAPPKDESDNKKKPRLH